MSSHHRSGASIPGKRRGTHTPCSQPSQTHPAAVPTEGHFMLQVMGGRVLRYGDLPVPHPVVLLYSDNVNDIREYSRGEGILWVLRMAQDICDPVHQSGSLFVCTPPSQNWHPADLTETVHSAIYEYRPPGLVSLSKQSKRDRKSLTSATGSAADMRIQVLRRDQIGWISEDEGAVLTNSHICPKRMGDDQSRYIYEIFCGVPPAPGLDIYNPVYGIALSSNLDKVFDAYKLGFRLVNHNPVTYEAHVFGEEYFNSLRCNGTNITRVGRFAAAPLLHAYQFEPPTPSTTTIARPPPGLFRWHYLQCVLQRFGRYTQSEPNIAFYELPFRTESDEEEIDDEDGEAGWPSAAYDLGRMHHEMEMDARAAASRTQQWVSTDAH